jgi:cyclic dehypoxanthinyl futalosine synthase
MYRYQAAEALELYKMPLFELAQLADQARLAHGHQDRVSFVLDRNITYTNVCTCRCRFCAYYVSPDSPKAFVLNPEEIADKVKELVALGGTQIMLQGGLNPQLNLAWYQKMLRVLKERFDVTLHSLSPTEICHIADLEGISLLETISVLQEAGLDSIPGGGAEILVDRVRNEISPNKINTNRWFEVMETAHTLGMKTTATMVFGHIETLEERIEHLERVRDMQDKTGVFRAFIAWPFSPGNTKIANIERTSGEDYLRTIAIARLYLDNVTHINSGWVTEGEKIAQVALSFGANDLGGILMEEVVVKATGLENHVTVASLKRLTEDAGLTLVRRDSAYNMLENV